MGIAGNGGRRVGSSGPSNYTTSSTQGASTTALGHPFDPKIDGLVICLIVPSSAFSDRSRNHKVVLYRLHNTTTRSPFTKVLLAIGRFSFSGTVSLYAPSPFNTIR